MHWTQCFIPTLKENPQDAVVKSHRLMLRAGLVRKLSSGTYTYLPLGLRSLQKVTEIIREEMNRTGALELLLPALHPAELWKETGRFSILGDDMIHFKDRHGKENVLGPTHEEVITDLVRREIQSYKQLPVALYQIQTKFRDEARPRSGVIRSREFIMKDAYSFHADEASLDQTYQNMKAAYQRIFTRCGLEFHVVQADPGAMGGSGSQEFVLFSDAGEDRMVQSAEIVMSVEMAHRKLAGLPLSSSKPAAAPKEIATPGHSSVEGVAAFLKKKPADLVKTMIYEIPGESSGGLFAVLIRGDHEVSEFKIKKLRGSAKMPPVLASREKIESLGSAFGFSGPLGLTIPLYIDEDVLRMRDFVTGANKAGYHLIDVNIGHIAQDREGKETVIGDFRQVVDGDVSPEGHPYLFHTAIELGHIFKLNLRYSEPMKARFLDETGKEKPIVMGCYGIGVNRILAAAIEQWSDDKGIVWPRHIAPFEVGILMLDPKDAQSQEIVHSLTQELDKLKIDYLIDDREESAGVKFKDADLIGLPLRVILGPKNLKLGKVEIKLRKTHETLLVEPAQVAPEIVKQLDKMN